MFTQFVLRQVEEALPPLLLLQLTSSVRSLARSAYALPALCCFLWLFEVMWALVGVVVVVLLLLLLLLGSPKLIL